MKSFKDLAAPPGLLLLLFFEHYSSPVFAIPFLPVQEPRALLDYGLIGKSLNHHNSWRHGENA